MRGGLGDRNGSIYGRVSGRRGIVRDDGYGRLCRGDNRLDLGNRLGTASPAIPSACPSIVPLVVAMVTVACMPKTVAGVGIIGFGAGMSLAASDISDSDGSGVAGVAGVPGTPECCAVGTASTSS